jgi:uncharacterized protein YndB with AHSA1/START domain
METTQKKPLLTVQTVVNAPVDKVWEYWTKPEHITQWCQASDDWHAPKAENELKVGGNFSTTMAAKDGSFSFDFGGVYTKVETNKAIEYTLGDGRDVKIRFTSKGDTTEIVESFEAEDTHSLEMQQGGWQAIMDNFKKYVEGRELKS